jgi:UDP-2-acetamido-2,6-beta-L-arabino-hexul-4-ose reductase
MELKVVVTGASGFIGKHLCRELEKDPRVAQLVKIPHTTDTVAMAKALHGADFIYHLAGVNRPSKERGKYHDNASFTRRLCLNMGATPEFLEGQYRKVLYASSIHVDKIGDGMSTEDPYKYAGSKLAAEKLLQGFANGYYVECLRLPGVFGPDCEPNYNSVTATFCALTAAGSPLVVMEQNKGLTLVYINDVIEYFVSALDSLIRARKTRNTAFINDGVTHMWEHVIQYVYVGKLAERITAFADIARKGKNMPDMSDKYNRDLYATYLSYKA